MIPNLFHFCYGLLPEPPFGFLEYLAIQSAQEINRPERIYLHYQYEGSGPWWDKVLELVTLNRVEAPREIFGRTLHHYAHQSDVLRLRMLQEHGGIYMDIDTLCLRPFTPLLDQRCVLAWQGNWGLCNAVILSEPNGQFVHAWLESYRTFRATGRDAYWGEHSVSIPRRLARQPQLRPHVTILGHRAFFFPLWDDMSFLFESNDPIRFRNSYCLHYWESLTKETWLRRIDPEEALRENTNFGRFVRCALCGPCGADLEADAPKRGPLPRAMASLAVSLESVRWIDALRHKVKGWLHLCREAKWLPRLIRNLGGTAVPGHLVRRLRLTGPRWQRSALVSLRSKRAAYPLACRTVDLASFDQVFIVRRYQWLDGAEAMGLIVDCGARVGFASAYFLTRFPAAKVIAVEPEPENFSLLQANLAPYGDRCQTLCAAAWPHAAGLVLCEPTAGEGDVGRRRIRPPIRGETPRVAGCSLETLLRQSGTGRISLLRLNLGGTETAIFASDIRPWLGMVDCLAVELHGDASRAAVRDAIPRDDFTISEFEDLIYCTARRPAAAQTAETSGPTPDATLSVGGS